MARVRHNDDPKEGSWGAWFGLVRFLGVVLFTALLFLLARSMVMHHFFTGGAQNYHNSPTGP
jgi:hypothetical protein